MLVDQRQHAVIVRQSDEKDGLGEVGPALDAIGGLDDNFIAMDQPHGIVVRGHQGAATLAVLDRQGGKPPVRVGLGHLFAAPQHIGIFARGRLRVRPAASEQYESGGAAPAIACRNSHA
ncbi:hypothetical protein D3C72_1990420 [compost metagenome]